MTITYFDPIHTPLLNGVNLIEASAGTGKTYAIAMLVLRFVVEQDVDIKNILVVTFTKAATEELKDRIRARLTEAKAALLGKTLDIDDNILEWLAQLSLESQLIKSRLELALLDIDQAGIFTIHGFCQRVLTEHALESGELFDSELTGEVEAIKQAVADDFWRRQVYPRPAWEAVLLTAHYSSPDSLLASVRGIPAHIPLYPDAIAFEQVLDTFKLRCQQAFARLPFYADQLKCHFAEDTFKTSYVANFDSNYQTLLAWLRTNPAQASGLPLSKLGKHLVTLPDFMFFSSQGLKEGLNGQKFRTTKAQTGEQRKAGYLASLNIDLSCFDDLADSFKQIGLAFRRALLDDLRENLDKRMRRLNVLSFDDLIDRLACALTDAKGESLKAELQQRFKVALIDEFQDTDQKQWFIFSTVYGIASHSLYLIGDPKQAIYKFRGADIYSYFDAQQRAQHHFTLAYNWRSHPQLVHAVNSLFQRERPFLFEQVNFTPVKPGLDASAGYFLGDDTILAPLHIWQLSENTNSSGYWSAGKAADEIRTATVNEILLLLSAHAVAAKSVSQSLQPRDIAILVKTNQQARDYQRILREAGIPAVLNSTESVFSSREALDLYRLLQALANPGDLNLLKQALTINWFALNGQQLFQTINDETLLDAWIFRFQAYHQTWLKKGFMAMLKQLFEAEKVTVNLAQTRLAERRLTNLQHLMELIQQAALNEHLGVQLTLDWLRSAITKAEQGHNSLEEQQLRLESDADAVKIVTLHRSKGLEYAVVFCPNLWQRNDFLNSERHLILCHDHGQMIADIGSPLFEQRREQALQEELAEDLRILYVALTRAKYRCYLVWANVRSKDKPNNSAMAYLFDFAQADFKTQQQRLQAYAEQQPGAFYYRLLDAENLLDEPLPNRIDPQTLIVKQRQRSLYTSWQMSSYTALSMLSLEDAPELPEDKVNEPAGGELAGETSIVPEPALEFEQLPKGVQTGNAIHALLENLRFADCLQAGAIVQARDALCQRYGLKLPDPSLIDRLLKHIVSTPLSPEDPDFCLKNIDDRHCLKEMPFYLSMQTLDASQINPILEYCPAYQPLMPKQMCGFLTGFIDLICRYQGRYYVIDYKTNSLPDYRPDTLTLAMREHNYGLQYWLYSVVLHRYLQQRLPDYRHAAHFGGVRYLFVRGMQPEHAASGVYADLPAFEPLQRLADLFEGRD